MTSDVLDDARILIVHHGKSSCYWPGPKSLLPSLSKRADGTGPARFSLAQFSLIIFLHFSSTWVGLTFSDRFPHQWKISGSFSYAIGTVLGLTTQWHE